MLNLILFYFLKVHRIGTKELLLILTERAIREKCLLKWAVLRTTRSFTTASESAIKAWGRTAVLSRNERYVHFVGRN